MAVAQFRGDLSEGGLSQALVDLIRLTDGPIHYFRMLDVNPLELAALLRKRAAAADMGDERSTHAV